MSIHVLSWVLRHSPAEKSRRLVLIVLADKANDDGTGAYPSIETIRRETRLESKSTVHDALRELEETGQIRRCGKGPKGTTRWQIVMAEEASFFRRAGGSSPLLEEPEHVTDSGDTKIGPPPEIGPKPSLGTAQRELDLEDGSMDGSDPEIGPPALEAWEEIRAAIRERVRPETFEIWLAELELVRLRGRRDLVLYAPPHAIVSAGERFGAKITAAARQVLGDRATVTFTTQAPPRRLPAGREGDRKLDAA